MVSPNVRMGAPTRPLPAKQTDDPNSHFAESLGGSAVWERSADGYNRISEAASRAGMRQFLHDELQMSAMRTIGDPIT